MVDRELAFLDRDAQKKLEAFEKARTVSKIRLLLAWVTTDPCEVSAESWFLPVEVAARTPACGFERS